MPDGISIKSPAFVASPQKKVIVAHSFRLRMVFVPVSFLLHWHIFPRSMASPPAREEPVELDALQAKSNIMTGTLSSRNEALSIAPTENPPETPSTSAQQLTEKDAPHNPSQLDDASTQPDSKLNEHEGLQGPEYPSLWKLGLLATALCLSTFCLALDNTIIATAIPRITDQFQSLEDVGWYASSYLLTTCSVTLMFGKIYTFYSTKWVYLIALFIFELGSLICGVAPNSVALIVGRAIAGLGAAGLFSGGILIIAQSVALERRPIFAGLLGSMFGIASVAGPLIGGAFTDKLTWRWCFYINLPVGGVTALFIILFFKAPKSVKCSAGIKDQLSQLDLPGTLAFIPAIISVLLALQWGGTKYPWSNGRIIALFVLFGVLIIAFVAIQIWRQGKATIPPRIFKNRNVWGCCLYLVFIGAAFFVIVYYMPIWFQAIKGVSAMKSGIMSIPMLLTMVVCALLSGAMVTAFGHYGPFLLFSPIIMSIGCGLLTTLTPESGHPYWIGYQALAGIGAGIGMQQPMIAVQAVLPFEDIPTATATLMFAQTLGGALFCSVAQNIFANQLAKNLVTEVPSIDPARVIGAGATMLRKVVSSEELPAVLVAYSQAITEAFYVTVATSVISFFGVIGIRWVSVKGRNVETHAM